MFVHSKRMNNIHKRQNKKKTKDKATKKQKTKKIEIIKKF